MVGFVVQFRLARETPPPHWSALGSGLNQPSGEVPLSTDIVEKLRPGVSPAIFKPD